MQNKKYTKKEKSCGVIAYTIIDNEIKYLLIKQINLDIGFPKGHMEPGESEEETAIRETKEETGVDVTLIPGFREEISYEVVMRHSWKTTVYFLGYFKNQEPVFQKEELLGIRLLSYKEACDAITFDNTLNIFKKAVKYIKNTKCIQK